jgi:hypothetical protein
MKNLILLVALSVVTTSAVASECGSGRCSAPLKRTATKVVDVTRNVVSAPVRLTRNFVSNVQSRRLSRRCR